MPGEPRIERSYRVRFDEAGPDGQLRSSGFMRFAQDLAWIHSESAGFGREWYLERGLTWLVRGIELDIRDDVAYGGELRVSTEVIGFRRVWARRKSEFRVPGSNRPAAEALTDWVLLNARGMPTRIPAEIAEAFASHAPDYVPLRLRPPPIPDDAITVPLTVRRSELDPMAHVNNAAYLDYLDEHLFSVATPREPLPTPRRYQAEFVASAEPNAKLVGHGWQDDGGWWYRLEDEASNEMLRARLQAGQPRNRS